MRANASLKRIMELKIGVGVLLGIALVGYVAIAAEQKDAQRPSKEDRGSPKADVKPDRLEREWATRPGDAEELTRFRVVTSAGVLVIYDAALPPGTNQSRDREGADRRNREQPTNSNNPGFVAYWNDFATESLYVLDRLLFTPDDAIVAVGSLQRDFGLDPVLFASDDPGVSRLSSIPPATKGAARDYPPESPLGKGGGEGTIDDGSWQPASRELVLSIMGFAADEEGVGGVAGTIWDCGPILAAGVIDPLTEPPPGASPDSLLLLAADSAGCPPGGGDPPDPFRNIRLLAEHLMVMEDDLLFNHFDPSICPFTDVTAEVLTSVNGANYLASAPVSLKRDGIERRTGSVSVTTADGSDTVGLQIVTSGVAGVDPQWTLNQTMWLNGEELTFYGSIQVVEPGGNSYTLACGWTYSATTGAVIDPSSDPEFQNTLANMQGFEVPVVAGGGLSPGEILSFISNAATLALNYLLDVLYPYTAPTNCGGPVLGDSTCAVVNTPTCLANIPQIALFIDTLPDVSRAFKKCMKGRFVCGGSFHPGLRLRCDESSSCGPCGYVPGAWGCNLGGRDIWYCYLGSVPCNCEMTVFHEASHACGALDLRNGAPLDSYRIGYWFRDRCNEPNPPEP